MVGPVGDITNQAVLSIEYRLSRKGQANENPRIWMIITGYLLGGRSAEYSLAPMPSCQSAGMCGALPNWPDHQDGAESRRFSHSLKSAVCGCAPICSASTGTGSGTVQVNGWRPVLGRMAFMKECHRSLLSITRTVHPSSIKTLPGR
jgi:hypothetical protein